jgi:hypothetical protein
MPVEPISTVVRDAFLASSPPRIVPQEIYQRAIPWKATVMNCIAGVLVLSVGLLLSGFIVPRHFLQQWRLDKGPVAVVSGQILKADETRTSVNENRVWKYEFSYRPEGRPERNQVAYTSGRPWEADTPVDVRYLIADPDVAVPVGARMDEFPAWAVWLLIVPAFGLFGIILPFRTRLIKRRLLRHGLIGEAIVDSVEMTSTRVNNQNVYGISLTNQSDGSRLRKRSYNTEEIDMAEARRKAGEPLTVIYERSNPKRFLIVDDWFGRGSSVERFSRENRLTHAAPLVGPGGEEATGSFYEMPAPRQVPKGVMKAATAPGGGWGFHFYGGIIFFGIGLLFMWSFFPFHLPKQWWLDLGPSRTVSGRILTVEDAEIDSDKRYRFSYPSEEGEKQGIAYITKGGWEVGRPVRVRYLLSHPEIAVPEGARMGPGALGGGSFALIFATVGGVLSFGPVVARFRNSKILRRGSLSTARVTRVEKMWAQVNDRDQYKLHLTRVDDGMKLVKRTLDRDEISFAMGKQDDGVPVKILYLPGKPKHFLMPQLWNGLI